MWIDRQIVDDFSKEDIYLWLYILTSPRTKLCGVLHNNISMIAFETKLSKNDINNSLYSLEYVHKVIKYNQENDEILILNWDKYNWSKSPKLIDSIEKQYKDINTPEFLECIKRKIDTLKSLR